MAQGGLIGNGIRVAYATGSPHTWKKLEQVMDATPPTVTNSKVDTTVHKDNDFKTNTTGLADVSDTVVKIMTDPDPTSSPNQNAMFNLRQAKTLVWWRVEIPADADRSVNSYYAYEFQGRVGSVKPSAPINGAQMKDITVVFGGTSLQEYQPMASQIG